MSGYAFSKALIDSPVPGSPPKVQTLSLMSLPHLGQCTPSTVTPPPLALPAPADDPVDDDPPQAAATRLNATAGPATAAIRRRRTLFAGLARICCSPCLAWCGTAPGSFTDHRAKRQAAGDVLLQHREKDQHRQDRDKGAGDDLQVERAADTGAVDGAQPDLQTHGQRVEPAAAYQDQGQEVVVPNPDEGDEEERHHAGDDQGQGDL